MRKVITVVAAMGAGACLADGTNLDFAGLTATAQSAVAGVSSPAMYIFGTLVGLTIAVAVLRKLGGRK